VRVNQGDAVALNNILYRHIFEERRFSRAGLADDVHMLAAVGLPDAEIDSATVRGSSPD
jgi:hypothetical protein